MSEAYEYEPLGVENDVPEDQETNQADVGFLMQAIQSQNLCEALDDGKLAEIGQKVVEEYKIDLASREAEGYEKKLKDALALATLAEEAKSYPWPNASNVKLPLIIQAAIQFNARSYAALVDGPNIVKSRVLGQPTDEKRQRGERVSRHMSWQLLEEMEEWEDDTDQMLLRLAVLGTLVRKAWFDPVLGRNVSCVLSPDEFVVNYRSKRDLSVCPRATHVLNYYPHEITEKMRSGVWKEVDLGRPQNADNDNDAPHKFLEQHRLLDLDDDDYPEPYIVTVHEETNKVVRIVARFRKEGVKWGDDGRVVAIKPYRCFTKYGFIPNPDGSFYDVGFGTLLGPHAHTINSTINQLMDAGHLANVQGGFIGEGVSIKSGNLRFQPGEWKKANAAGGSLKDNIVPLPTREPSSVLFSLMTFLVESAKDLTATQDILTGDAAKANAPVGTTLALIEQGLKTFTAIVKRIHRSLKRELGVLYDLNATFLQPQVYFTFQDEDGVSGQADYAKGDLDLVPVSDPNMATDMQRMGRAQFLLSLRGAGLNDMEINKRALEAASIPDIEALMPKGAPPPDPRLVVEQKKLELQERELELKEKLAAVDAGKTHAETTQLEIQNFMAGPEMAAMMDQMALRAAQTILDMVSNGGSPGTAPQPMPVQPGDVPGMAGQPPEQPVLPVPEGSAGPVGPAMGLGAGDGQGPAGQGVPPGGIG